MSSRRSKRKSTTRGNYDHQSISSSHYVGYVEDEESVEAIMKKFEELEKIQNQPPSIPQNSSTNDEETHNSNEVDELNLIASEQNGASNNNQALTESQLEELFKNTSVFTVESALKHNQTYFPLNPTDYDDDDLEYYGDDLFILNEDEEFEEYDDIDLDDSDWELEMGLVSRKRVKRSSASGPREKRQSSTQKREHYRNTHLRVLDDLGKSFVLVKKQLPQDPTQPSYVRIPQNPIPVSWAHRIITLKQANQLRGGKRLGIDFINNFDQLIGFSGIGSIECILMNPPLVSDNFMQTNEEYLAHREPVTVSQLLALPVKRLLKSGFLMIFVPKPLISKVVQRISNEWKLRYVENVAWLQLTPNQEILKADLDDSYIRTSKLTLLMFRTEGDIDIRHQRSPDCVFDFVQPDVDKSKKLPNHHREFPNFIYKMIETLLPNGKTELDNGFKLIEMWGHPKSRRDGWLSIYHKNQ